MDFLARLEVHLFDLLYNINGTNVAVNDTAFLAAVAPQISATSPRGLFHRRLVCTYTTHIIMSSIPAAVTILAVGQEFLIKLHNVLPQSKITLPGRL